MVAQSSELRVEEEERESIFRHENHVYIVTGELYMLQKVEVFAYVTDSAPS